MIGVTVISVGTLKEGYLREAVAEYEKRLCCLCKLKLITLKEEKLSDSPSDGEIKNVLIKEGERIRSAIPPRACKIALCVEGKQLSSEKLAEKLEAIGTTNGEVCFIIGSSHGLCEDVKKLCDMRLSFSELTFPHQLMKVMLLEAIYRSFNIIKGTRYHK